MCASWLCIGSTSADGSVTRCASGGRARRGIAERCGMCHLSCYWQLRRHPPRSNAESIRVFVGTGPYAGAKIIDGALSPPAGASRQLKPLRLYKSQHERPREEVSNVGFVSALFSRTGLLIAIYIVIGVFVNTAPPHVPTGGANLLSLHSWVQYFISILFWPLSFWTPSFTVAKWQP